MPVSLPDAHLNSLVFGPHDEHTIDPVRRRSLLNRTTDARVRDWFFSCGIAHATGPVRVMAHRGGGVSRVVLGTTPGRVSEAVDRDLLRGREPTSLGDVPLVWQRMSNGSAMGSTSGSER